MLNTKNNFKALSLSTESEVLNSHKLHTCNNEKGRSMIEMLGVLAIIGVLSVGGIAGYSKAMMKFKTNKTLDQIAMTVTNIRTLYAQQLNYDGLETGNAYQMGVTDDAMGTESTLTNPFGGDVFIGTTHSGSAGEGDGTTDNRAFIVSFNGLPREACVAIATNDWGSGYSSGFLGITTSASELSVEAAAAAGKLGACNVTSNHTAQTVSGASITTTACNGQGPLSVAGAAAGCSCTTNACAVAFKYY